MMTLFTEKCIFNPQKIINKNYMFEQNREPVQTVSKVGLEPTFMGKVMTFFALAVFASSIGAYVTVRYFLTYFITNPVLMYILFAAELVIIFTAHWWKQSAPLNKVLFFAFAAITGITIAPLLGVLVQTPEGLSIVIKALFTTGLMFTATAIFAWTTKYDLSGLRGFLFMGLIGMIITSVVGIFIPWGSTFEIVFTGLGVILFAAYTMYDIQQLKKYPEDAYIDAAMQLYLDIFNLFLYILRLLMALSNRD